MGYRVSGDPVQRLRGWCPAGKHQSELFLEFLCLPLDSPSFSLCAVRWVKAARRRLSVSLESLRRAFHHVLRLFSVAIIERTEGTGTRWTVGAEPTEKVSRGFPPPAQILGNVFCEALTTQVRNTKRRTARADGWQRVLRDASGVAPQKASLVPKGRLEAGPTT